MFERTQKEIEKRNQEASGMQSLEETFGMG